MDDKQIAERDPVAMQQEILLIEKEMGERQPGLEAKHKAFQEARAEFEVEKMWFKIAKDRRSGLQSVLKSVSII